MDTLMDTYNNKSQNNDLVQRYWPARALRSQDEILLVAQQYRLVKPMALVLSHGWLLPCGTNSPEPLDCHHHYRIFKSP